ncbi:MAG: hypothetical protein JW934_20430 [Anaerolineae bacterium]|nr:hypothetical protein [Anaerolineae bacterium]
MSKDLLEPTDSQYLEIILNRIRACIDYQPALGTRRKITWQDFQQLYGSDPFYSWFGLDDPLMYAAHRAAGGMTSIYRQIGLGCEELFRQILQDHLGLATAQVIWSYETGTGDRKRRFSLDGRIRLSDVASETRKALLGQWIVEAARRLGVTPEISGALEGIVFEIRQGYKSKDSKRQNADLANAATAYTQGYLPVLMVLSTQIDDDLVERYRHGRWFILQGHLQDSSFDSTFAFMAQIVGYDLAGLFRRHSDTLRATVAEILSALLQAGSVDG